jgi:hypothetical protein
MQDNAALDVRTSLIQTGHGRSHTSVVLSCARKIHSAICKPRIMLMTHILVISSRSRCGDDQPRGQGVKVRHRKWSSQRGTRFFFSGGIVVLIVARRGLDETSPRSCIEISLVIKMDLMGLADEVSMSLMLAIASTVIEIRPCLG